MDYTALLHECEGILKNAKVPPKKPKKREYFNHKTLIYCEDCGTPIAETNSSNYCHKCRPKHLIVECKNPRCTNVFEVDYPGQYQFCPTCRYRDDSDGWNTAKRISPRREGKWWDKHTEQLMHYYGNWWV